MEEENSTKKPSKNRKWFIIGGILIVLVLIASTTTYFLTMTNLLADPLNKGVSKSLPYDIYYPDPRKLPIGYALNTDSFTVTPDKATTYTVSYGNGQLLDFSLDKKIPTSQLNTFYTNYIPLHLTKSSSVGTATIGVVHNQTVISIPTNTNTWIIITAPLNYDQQNLQQLLNSLALAKK